MANKNTSETKVTRIKATDTRPSKKQTVPTPKSTASVKKAKASTTSKKAPAILRPFLALGGYFKGAWLELREVRWPTRRATWSLTVAVIVFSVFLGVVILLLDALFKFIFEQILV